MFPDHPEYCDIIVYCKYVACSLSIVGSITVLLLIVLLRKYTVFAQRLIAYLSVASLVMSVAFLPSDFSTKPSTLCVVQGAVVQFFVMNAIYWINVITINFYWSVFYEHGLKRYELMLLVMSVLIPGASSAAPFLGHHTYGPAGAWCWLSDIWEWRFGVWYIWRITTLAVMIVVVSRIVCHLNLYSRTRHSFSDFRTVSEDIRTLRLYPVVYLLVSLFPVINRVQNAIKPDDPVFVLFVLQACTDPLFGAIVAIIFLLDGNTRRALSVSKCMVVVRRCRTGSTEIRRYDVE